MKFHVINALEIENLTGPDDVTKVTCQLSFRYCWCIKVVTHVHVGGKVKCIVCVYLSLKVRFEVLVTCEQT